jgi:predicted dehydrogenase
MPTEPAIGIIGAGAIARSHVDSYRAAGVRVRGAMSRSRSDAQRLEAEFATDDLHELLADAEITAVDICAPTDVHAEIALAAAAEGKHVHLEKPMALSLADADRIIDACDRAGVLLMVGQTARYQAASRAMRAAVAGGDIGTPIHVEMVWDHGVFWPGGWRGWQIDPRRSGGHLVHNGVHAFDLACWLLGDRPISVYAQGRAAAHPGMATSDYWQALVTFASGATALCETGYILPQPGGVHRELRVYGAEGMAEHSTDDDGVVYAGDGARSARLVGADAMRVQIADWVACLRGSRGVPVSGEDGRRALAVSLAAQRALDSGRAVDVCA